MNRIEPLINELIKLNQNLCRLIDAIVPVINETVFDRYIALGFAAEMKGLLL